MKGRTNEVALVGGTFGRRPERALHRRRTRGVRTAGVGQATGRVLRLAARGLRGLAGHDPDRSYWCGRTRRRGSAGRARTTGCTRGSSRTCPARLPRA